MMYVVSILNYLHILSHLFSIWLAGVLGDVPIAHGFLNCIHSKKLIDTWGTKIYDLPTHAFSK